MFPALGLGSVLFQWLDHNLDHLSQFQEDGWEVLGSIGSGALLDLLVDSLASIALAANCLFLLLRSFIIKLNSLESE